MAIGHKLAVLLGRILGLSEALAAARLENQDLRKELAAALLENQELKEKLQAALQTIAQLQQQVEDLRKGPGEEEKGKSEPPSFVKANRAKPEGPKQPRRLRAPEHNHGRPREEPTRIVRHALERCPTCDYWLQGESIDYVRQVIELPAPQPIEVIEHQVIKRYCPCCGKYRSPQLDLSGEVIGQGRMGVRLASLIVYLRQGLRMPIESVRTYLDTIHQMSISRGGVVGLLRRAGERARDEVEGLKQELRGSRIVHGDETGWREDGRNGYIWSFSTPGEAGVRYYEYDATRAGHVVKRIMGQGFRGHLASDFYSAYNDNAWEKQRCWVHLLRDLHKLKEKQPESEEVLAWALGVRALYDEANEWLTGRDPPSEEERKAKYRSLLGRVRQLGLAHAQAKGHPCQTLAKRLMQFEDELFQFVLVPGLSADNNLAERSLRGLVVIRKISGGSRSAEGTKARMALASLTETWKARGQNPFIEWQRLLSRPATPSAKISLPQV